MSGSTQNRGRLRRSPIVAVVIALLALAACDGARDSHLLSPDGVGTVEGRAFLDLNRDGLPSGGEPSLPGLRIALVTQGSQDEVTSTTSDEEGAFRLRDVPAGSYRVRASGGPMGDTLGVTGVEPELLEVAAGRTQTLSVGVSFPLYRPSELQGVQQGNRVYVEGIALNGRGLLPDDAVHVWDGSRAARVEEVAAFGMSPGDSVRLLGRTELRSGRIVVRGAVGFRIAELPDPEPVPITTAEASTARQGELDAALVRIQAATVSDVRTSNGTRRVTASDGSGSVHVRIPNAHLTQSGIPALQPGALLSVSGILLPTETGAGWELRTRSGADLAADAAGSVAGHAFLDMNGSGTFDGTDSNLPGMTVRLFRQSDATSPVATLQTDGSGRFRLDEVQVGSYRLEVDESSIPDTLVVRSIVPETIDVPTNDTARVAIAVSHPFTTVAGAREMLRGQTIFVEGIALNATSTFGNNSVHIRDGGRAIRALNVGVPSVNAGERVRFRARTDSIAGQPVLTNVTPFFPGGSGSQAPLPVSTGDAASAQAGDLDANLVQVRDAVIESSTGGSTTWTVRVQDGSGIAEASIRLATVNMTSEEAAAAFAPGRIVTLTGVLIPNPGGGGWRLHPRARGDIVVQP